MFPYEHMPMNYEVIKHFELLDAKHMWQKWSEIEKSHACQVARGHKLYELFEIVAIQKSDWLVFTLSSHDIFT